MEFRNKLISLKACPKARKWVGARTLEEAWQECPRGDWMIWLSMRMASEPGWSSAEETIEVLCDIVEPALQRVPAEETRPAYAVATVRRWCAGEATSSELRAASDAADDATYFAAAKYVAAKYADADAVAVATYAVAANAAEAAAATAFAADAVAVAVAANAVAEAAGNAAAAAAVARSAYATDAEAEAAMLAQQAELIRVRVSIGGC